MRFSLMAFRSAFASLSALMLTMALTVVFAFLTQLLLARALEPSGYGTLATAMTTITLLSPLAGFGIGKYWLRAFGLEGWAARRWFRASFWLAGLASALAMLLIAIWALASAIDPTIRLVTIILLPTLLVYPLSELAYARLQLEGRYGILALWQMMPNLARVTIAALAFMAGLDLLGIAWGLTASLSTVSLGLGIVLWRMLHGRFDLDGHGPRPQESSPTSFHAPLVAVLQQSWPFALAGVFYLIYFQSDILLLGWMVGPEAAGLYNTAFAVMAAVYLLPSVAYQKYLLPKLHRWAEHDRPRFLAVYRFGNAASLLLGLAVAAALLLVAPGGMPLVFGEAYRASGQLLLVLALAIPGRYLATSVGSVLVTQDNMRRKVWLMGLTALVNLALNVLLIPRYGIYGAAWATVASESVLLLAYLYAAWRYVFGREAFHGWTLRLERNP